MSPANIPLIPPERWIANLLEVAREFADKETQERRRLDPDRYAWERPEELLTLSMLTISISSSSSSGKPYPRTSRSQPLNQRYGGTVLPSDPWLAR
jgi:hypothetical protein